VSNQCTEKTKNRVTFFSATTHILNVRHNSQMEKLFSIIKSNLIGILIGSGILWWGFANDGYVRIIIGLLILFAVIKSGIDNFNYARELDNWIKQNQNSLILFYPCKKPIQDLIKD
ncbi:hypothetical protein, partial [uncultured Aquimarina sp.]|uniref:hypothetical protein n=1 Tax=uncultured Aquimarina sp. TaxID=575652 RepID=UPI0026133C86